MQNYDFVRIHSFLLAVGRMIDPHRAVLAAKSPYIMTGGKPLDLLQLIAGGKGAHEHADADLIHLVFEPGQEAQGPSNVMVVMAREGVIGIRSESRFWLDERGKPFLVARSEGKFATMSFDPDGMDSRPGAPADDLEPGYAGAAKLLRKYAAAAAAANDLAAHTVERAA